MSTSTQVGRWQAHLTSNAIYEVTLNGSAATLYDAFGITQVGSYFVTNSAGVGFFSALPGVYTVTPYSNCAPNEIPFQAVVQAPILQTDYAFSVANCVGQTVDRRYGASTSLTITSQQLYACLIYLEQGKAVNNITWCSGNTAAVTPANWWFCVLDSNLNMLAVTADQTTTAWAASTAKTLAIASVANAAGNAYVASTSYTPSVSGTYYVGLMVNAATPPTLFAANGNATLAGLSPTLCGGSTGSLTTPPALPFQGTALVAKSAVGWATCT